MGARRPSLCNLRDRSSPSYVRVHICVLHERNLQRVRASRIGVILSTQIAVDSPNRFIDL